MNSVYMDRTRGGGIVIGGAKISQKSNPAPTPPVVLAPSSVPSSSTTTNRSNSLDQLNFQEKRQLIASTLSLSELLGASSGKSSRGKLKVVVEPTFDTPDTGTTVTTCISSSIAFPSTTSNYNLVSKSAAISLSDLISGNKTKGNYNKKGEILFKSTYTLYRCL